jgi:hypothetical protein
LKLDETGIEGRLGPFRRVRFTWTELKSVDAGEKLIVFISRAGHRQTMNPGRLNNRDAVRQAIFSSDVPSPNTFKNTIPVYIVITPRGGILTNNPNLGGAHARFCWNPANTDVIYAYVGAQGDLHDTVPVATHEIVEALGANGGAPKELCDDCQNLYGQGVDDGFTFTVASYFDASTNQCVAPPIFHKPAA